MGFFGSFGDIARKLVPGGGGNVQPQQRTEVAGQPAPPQPNSWEQWQGTAPMPPQAGGVPGIMQPAPQSPYAFGSPEWVQQSNERQQKYEQEMLAGMTPQQREYHEDMKQYAHIPTPIAGPKPGVPTYQQWVQQRGLQDDSAQAQMPDVLRKPGGWPGEWRPSPSGTAPLPPPWQSPMPPQNPMDTGIARRLTPDEAMQYQAAKREGRPFSGADLQPPPDPGAGWYGQGQVGGGGMPWGQQQPPPFGGGMKQFAPAALSRLGNVASEYRGGPGPNPQNASMFGNMQGTSTTVGQKPTSSVGKAIQAFTKKPGSTFGLG